MPHPVPSQDAYGIVNRARTCPRIHYFLHQCLHVCSRYLGHTSIVKVRHHIRLQTSFVIGFSLRLEVHLGSHTAFYPACHSFFAKLRRSPLVILYLNLLTGKPSACCFTGRPRPLSPEVLPVPFVMSLLFEQRKPNVRMRVFTLVQSSDCSSTWVIRSGRNAAMEGGGSVTICQPTTAFGACPPSRGLCLGTVDSMSWPTVSFPMSYWLYRIRYTSSLALNQKEC